MQYFTITLKLYFRSLDLSYRLQFVPFDIYLLTSSSIYIFQVLTVLFYIYSTFFFIKFCREMR
jgi:hypothetical protein